MLPSTKSSRRRRHSNRCRRRSFISVAATACIVMSLLLLCQMATPVEGKKNKNKNKKDKADKKNRIKSNDDKNSMWKGGLEELLDSTSGSTTTTTNDAADPVLVDDTDMKVAKTSDKSSSSSKKQDDQIAADEDAMIDGSDSAKSSSNKSKKDKDKEDDIMSDQANNTIIDVDGNKSSKSDKNKSQSSNQVSDVDVDSVSPDSITTTRADCVPCTNIPSHKMIALRQDCTSVPHLAFRCSRRNFARHHFCAKSCFETGATGYAAMNCCADNKDTNANIIIDARGDDGEGTDEVPVVDSSTPFKPSNVHVPTMAIPTLSPNPPPTSPSPTTGKRSTLPSSSPTTSTPTLSPTRLQSNIPTSEKSNVPSANPTSAAPTSSPTKMHSSKPSAAPTSIPTSSPTPSPTKMYSSHPSMNPTYAPTVMPSRSPSRSPSTKPSVQSSPSPSDIVEVDNNSDCVQCSDEVTPWMLGNNQTCALWPLTGDRCSTTYWLNKQFCSHTCSKLGKGYAGTNCCPDKEENPTSDTSADCVACSDVESGWMIANGFACATWKGLKGKCGPNGATQSFIDNKFCAQSCFERYGISYLDIDGNEEKCCNA